MNPFPFHQVYEEPTDVSLMGLYIMPYEQHFSNNIYNIFNHYVTLIYSSFFQWLVPNGGWIRNFNEIIMNICDFLFGTGNWLWAQYGQWIILEGIIASSQIYGQSRNLNNIQAIGNNSYYQG